MQPDTDIIIINQTVCFSPGEHLLYPAGRKQDALSLNVPVSRCLALLLSRAGEVVSRQTFYAEVWENQGLYVTDNTFYQNISLLRKTLRAAGIHDNIIQTVPREGIRFTGTAESALSIPEGPSFPVQDIILSPTPRGSFCYIRQTARSVFLFRDVTKNNVCFRGNMVFMRIVFSAVFHPRAARRV